MLEQETYNDIDGQTVFLLSFVDEKLAEILGELLHRHFQEIEVVTPENCAEKKGHTVLLTDSKEMADKAFGPFLLFGSRATPTPSTITLPFRAGFLLDRLQKLIAENSEQKTEDIISFGLYALHMRDGRLLREKEAMEPVTYLTEKERAILYLLYKAGGQTVTRKELLSHVWEYAEDVETHTLETHIYRLRQKIEENPARPLLLLTDEEGYYLGGL